MTSAAALPIATPNPASSAKTEASLQKKKGLGSRASADLLVYFGSIRVTYMYIYMCV